jgi:hypothetical protein
MVPQVKTLEVVVERGDLVEMSVASEVVPAMAPGAPVSTITEFPSVEANGDDSFAHQQPLATATVGAHADAVGRSSISSRIAEVTLGGQTTLREARAPAT